MEKITETITDEDYPAPPSELDVLQVRVGEMAAEIERLQSIIDEKKSADRDTIINILVSSGNLSEGVTADLIIGAIGAQQSPAVAVPDECCATGQSCDYEICTLNGEQQCKYCGKEHPDMSSPRITEQDAREIIVSFSKFYDEDYPNDMFDDWIDDGRALLNKLNAKGELCELCESLDPWQQAEGTKCPAHTKPKSVGG